LYEVLSGLEEVIRTFGIERAVEKATLKLEQTGTIDVEYLELVDPNTLKPATNGNGPIQACIAAWIGGVRLIDNLRVK
jgi:pantothenate synthetase